MKKILIIALFPIIAMAQTPDVIVSNLVVQGVLTAGGIVGSVPLAGGTMTGGLTNEVGFFGDGSGLTNLPTSGGDTSGIHAPYTNAPASPVTIDAANGWWQTLTATGATEILLADKPATNNGASVRLDFWTLHSTTITNIEGYASLSISTSAVNVLLFDNPSDRGVTNWYVEQLYP